MEDKQMINEVLNRQMKDLERQYQEIRLEEKEPIESTRKKYNMRISWIKGGCKLWITYST